MSKITAAFNRLEQKQDDLYHVLCEQTREVCEWGMNEGLLADNALDKVNETLDENFRKDYRSQFKTFRDERLFLLDQFVRAKYFTKGKNISEIYLSKLSNISLIINGYFPPDDISNKISAVKNAAHILIDTFNYDAHNNHIESGVYLLFAVAILRLRETSSDQTYRCYQHVWKNDRVNQRQICQPCRDHG